MIRAGILSDTHIQRVTDPFKKLAHRAFSACDVIFHAGDITAMEVLEVFGNRPVYSVRGNMCSTTVQKTLPEHRLITLEGVRIGLCHGAGPRHNIEERMWALFPEADCIIYGHTHNPVCEKKGGVLFINPGSFQVTAPHAAPASYALLTIDKNGLDADLHFIRSLR
ncbi:MAG: metallophosphoesterase family protein [Desulfopila sp.]|nr:metallophosphoesterase family protein [Desulfopila sp.]